MTTPFRSLCLLVGFAFCVSGCQPFSATPLPADHDYFPVSPGHYVVYDVEEQQYVLNTPAVRRTYQVKETIGTPYTGLSGQLTHRLIRFQRPAEGKPWQADSVWTVRMVNNEIIRGENGLDFVQLVLPVSNGLRWDGNRYNQLGPDDYELRNSCQPYRVQTKQFNETVTVVAQDDSTLVSQDKRIRVYARGVGLIYKERTQFHFCTGTPACVGRNQIDYGIRQIYRIHSYGEE